MQALSHSSTSDSRFMQLQAMAEKAGMSCATYYQDSGEHDCAIITERLRREAGVRIRKRRLKG
jgi:uncharacterized protein with GYD domain